MAALRQPADERQIQKNAEAEKKRRHHQQGQEWVQREAGVERQRDVGPEHHQPSVRKVDDAHHAVDDGQPVSHDGVQTG